MPIGLARLSWVGAAVVFAACVPIALAQDFPLPSTQVLPVDLAREFERAWLQAQKRVAPLNRALVRQALRNRPRPGEFRRPRVPRLGR